MKSWLAGLHRFFRSRSFINIASLIGLTAVLALWFQNCGPFQTKSLSSSDSEANRSNVEGLSGILASSGKWLFVFAGQSNMVGIDGIGNDSSLSADVLDAPSNITYYWGNPSDQTGWPIQPYRQIAPHYRAADGSYPVAPNGNPAAGFARKIAQLYPDRQIVILTLAVGSTSLSNWLADGGTCGLLDLDQPNHPEAEARRELGRKLLTRIQQVRQAEGENIPVKGFFWYQGESDAGAGCYTDYATRLGSLFDRIHAFAADQTTPLRFVMTQISNYPADIARFAPEVRNQQLALSNNRQIPIVPVDDLGLISDRTHLKARDSLTVGERFALSFYNLEGGSSPTPQQPTPVGTLSVPSTCTVPFGAQTCNVNVQWATSNVSADQVLLKVSEMDDESSQSVFAGQMVSGATAAPWINPARNKYTFLLYAGPTLLAKATVRAVRESTSPATLGDPVITESGLGCESNDCVWIRGSNFDGPCHFDLRADGQMQILAQGLDAICQSGYASFRIPPNIFAQRFGVYEYVNVWIVNRDDKWNQIPLRIRIR